VKKGSSAITKNFNITNRLVNWLVFNTNFCSISAISWHEPNDVPSIFMKYLDKGCKVEVVEGTYYFYCFPLSRDPWDISQIWISYTCMWCYVLACCMAVFVFVNVSYFPFSHVLACDVLVWEKRRVWHRKVSHLGLHACITLAQNLSLAPGIHHRICNARITSIQRQTYNITIQKKTMHNQTLYPTSSLIFSFLEILYVPFYIFCYTVSELYEFWTIGRGE
jgi:hypothetical protein